MDSENEERTGQRSSILDYDVFDLADWALDAYPEPNSLADFGPYRIEGRIDKGGMGEVWLAYDEAAQRSVAIKIPRYLADPRLCERFATEVYNLGKLEHRFIARLYDHGVCPDGTPYFAMEFVDGKPLDEYCRQQQCSVEQRMRLFKDICEAVQYAHSRLVVHRDLKPSNILVKEDGTPKLLDFGIAKQLESLVKAVSQTRTDLRFTRAYAAPEQIRNEPAGTHMDVYALGVILYELLAGKPPFDFEQCTPGQAEVIIASEQEPEKPSASPNRIAASKAAWNDLDLLCLKAMKKDLSRRYATVVELSQDIDHYLRSEPLQARPDALSYRLGKFVRRRRRPILAAASALILVSGLVVFFTLRLKKERDRANHETAIATAMNRFLSDDLLGRTDPFKSGKAQEPFTDVVNRASSQIDAQFRNEPAVAAQLHETLARAFDNRSDFPQARREYDRANDLFERGEGPLSQDAVEVRLRRATMEAKSYEPGSLALAQSLVSGAQATIVRISRPRGMLEVLVLQTRGIVALISNNPRAAGIDFAAELQKTRTIPSLDETARVRIEQLLGFCYVRLGEGQKAEPIFKEVVTSYAKAYGLDSPEVLRARVNLAQALLVQHKYTDAIQETNLIYPALVKKLGDDHEVTMTMLGTRAVSEGSLGMWDDAIRDDLTLYRLSARKGIPVSHMALGGLSDAALSQCEAGRYADGESNARMAFQQARKAYGGRDGVTGGTSYALAVCLIGRDKLDEASDLLQHINVDATAQLAGDPTVGAQIDLAQADIATRRGNYALGQNYVAKAAPAFETPTADFGTRQSLARLRKILAQHKTTEPIRSSGLTPRTE
jgi:serine/threonine protein kinase